MPESLSSKRRDIELSRQQYFRQFGVRRNVLKARVIEINSDTESEFKPGFAHVLIYGVDEGGHATARIGHSQIAADMPVLIARDPEHPNEWQILGTYLDEIVPSAAITITRYRVENHGENHQWQTEATIGPDPVKIWQPALQPLKTTGDGLTLTITIQPLIYVVSGTRREFLGTTVDLTSSVPGVGLTRRVLIYLDETTNLINVLQGTTVATGPTPVPYPAIPNNAKASAYVTLVNGQTAVTTATHITDARDFLNSVTNNFVDSLLVRPELRNYSITNEVQNSVSGDIIIDLNEGNSQKIVVTGNITGVEITGVPAAGEEGSLTLYVVQGGSGSYSIEWPLNILWPNGVRPQTSTAVDSLDVYVFKTIDGGTIYIGAQIGKNFSNPGASSITADAWIEFVVTGSITADATIEAQQTGSVTADSTIEAQQTSSVTADADIV